MIRRLVEQMFEAKQAYNAKKEEVTEMEKQLQAAIELGEDVAYGYPAEVQTVPDEDVRSEMWRIRSLFRYTKDDSEDLITYAKEIVRLRRSEQSSKQEAARIK